MIHYSVNPLFTTSQLKSKYHSVASNFLKSLKLPVTWKDRESLEQPVPMI